MEPGKQWEAGFWSLGQPFSGARNPLNCLPKQPSWTLCSWEPITGGHICCRGLLHLPANAGDVESSVVFVMAVAWKLRAARTRFWSPGESKWSETQGNWARDWVVHFYISAHFGVQKNRHTGLKRVNVKFLQSENLTWRRVEAKEWAVQIWTSHTHL